MAKHATHKRTHKGREATLVRREVTRVKYRPAPSLADTARAVGAPIIGGEDK